MEKGMSQFSDKKPTKHKYKTLSKYLINSSNRRFHLRVSEHKEHKKITLGISEYNLENQESKLLGVHNLDAVQTIRNVFDVMVKKMEEHKAKELEEPEPEIRKERRIINLYREQFSDKIGNLIFNYTISLRTSNDGGYFIELILETTKLFSQAKAAKNEHKQVKLYIKGNILQEFRDTLTEILNIYNDVNVQKHLSKVDFYQPTIAKKAAKESIKEQS
uniref:Uncharacterized protein n=1 Tax=Acrobeloides nanus TaxID=290746 RepID=A0A914DHG8_9BILA